MADITREMVYELVDETGTELTAAQLGQIVAERLGEPGRAEHLGSVISAHAEEWGLSLVQE